MPVNFGICVGTWSGQVGMPDISRQLAEETFARHQGSSGRRSVEKVANHGVRQQTALEREDQPVGRPHEQLPGHEVSDTVTLRRVSSDSGIRRPADLEQDRSTALFFGEDLPRWPGCGPGKTLLRGRVRHVPHAATLA